MIRTDTRSFRLLATTLVAALVNLSVPVTTIALSAPHAKPEPKAPPKPVAPRSHVLTAHEMRVNQGRSGESPYLAGQNKWDVVYNGVNLLTGNYSLNGTDLSFEGGYGIPVNVTRSYSSNNAEDGPLGKGWNLSVDVRSTAGGVLKSSGAPVMSVPTTYKEVPPGDDDPRVLDPVKAVVATDAGGQEETVQEDVDGILTTPPWDHNVVDSTYDHITTSGGQTYDILLTNVVKTLDGTVYTYSKHGSYTSGMTARSGGTSGAPSYVLKVDTVTDRQGNVTTYNYTTSSPATFYKSNGTVSEDRLTSIAMPNGHTITFNWGNGTTAPTNRIYQAKDNGNVRVVTYSYDTNGMLASVTTPGGKTTSFAYGSAAAPGGWTYGAPNTLLTSITDPRGFQTQISYQMGYVRVFPGDSSATVSAPVAWKVKSGVRTGAVARVFVMCPDPHTAPPGGDPYPPVPNPGDGWQGTIQFYEYTDGTNSWINTGGIGATVDASSGVVEVLCSQLQGFGNPVGWEQNVWTKRYDVNTQDLVEEFHCIQPTPGYIYTGTPADLHTARKFPLPSNWSLQKVITTSEYNFTGKPLVQSTVEKTYNGHSLVSSGTTKSTYYAYWDADKYFQQKAVVDPAGRVSYTDYYTSAATAGARGQTREVYDPSHVGISAGYSPSGTWYNSIAPGSGAVASAKFYSGSGLSETPTYDPQGRCTDVWKLNRSASGYVQTHTSYGSDTDGSWGQASEVVEDYGTGHANRSTQTLHYTSWGKADKVQDALTRQFETTYDLDGQVQSVARVDVSPNVTLASYTYGSTAGTVEYGQPTQVTDGLSGVAQSVSYIQPGTSGSPNYGVGQVSSTSQSGGNADSYSVTYTYEDTGNRRTVAYSTPDGTSSWGYGDYIRVGDPTSPAPAFQTLVKLSSGVGTAEEIHYAYDSAGRLMHSAFAQSKQTRTGAPTSYPFYTSSYPAETRARASYDYDALGHVLGVSHWWDAMNSGHTAYVASPILKNDCSYDSVKGLKTASAYYEAASGSWPSTATTSESYTYDSYLDYLTGESDTTGGSTTSQSWSYDAAGNRSNSGYSYDDLNRMTASPTATYTNDTAGNRSTETTSAGTTTYAWDLLSRMIGRSGTTPGTTGVYEYRVDGLRTWKQIGTSVSGYKYELTRYDGQMPFEVETIGTSVTATRNVLGVRGVDAEESVTGTIAGTTRTLATSTIAYPLYDAHGNRVATVVRSGSSWSCDTPRYYDAWGNIFSGPTTGGSALRYCATFGHPQDDESGLIYMRARYYETGTGRFTSEDLNRDGNNWYAYCHNNPANFGDFTGKELIPPKTDPGSFFSQTAWFCTGNYLVYAAVALAFTKSITADVKLTIIAATLAASASAFSMALDWSDYNKSFAQRVADQLNLFGDIFLGIAAALATYQKSPTAGNMIAGVAILACVARDCQLLGALYGAIRGE